MRQSDVERVNEVLAQRKRLIRALEYMTSPDAETVLGVRPKKGYRHEIVPLVSGPELPLAVFGAVKQAIRNCDSQLVDLGLVGPFDPPTPP